MKVSLFLLSSVLLTACGGGSGGENNDGGTPPPSADPTIVSVGRAIFFDQNLSSNANQSCASCHDPAKGFSDPDSSVTAPVSEGSVAGQFGNRNAPTVAYASFSPEFRLTITPQTSDDGSKYEGGQFFDGRRSNLIEQAKDPFLNPVEMNNTDAADVVNKVRNASYANDFISVFGLGALDNVDTAYHNIAEALAEFQSSAEVNSFSSKYDALLLGRYNMTPSEARGFSLFQSDIAKCANCHTLSNTPGQRDLFTSFKYFNVGTPTNPNNPSSATDPGLGAALDPVESAEDGKFKTPTLRNIELTAPYMHNGVYATLREVIEHYDISVRSEFIEPEVFNNLATEVTSENLEGLGLSEQDYDDLIAFMKMLTDGYF